MRKRLAQHSDMLVLAVVLGLLVTGAGFAMLQARMAPDEWQKTAFETTRVPLENIVDSGLGRDGIQPIDSPHFVSPREAPDWLGSRSPVIVVELDEQARAYPLTILLRHEIVNDWIGTTAIAVTFCPLCNSPIVYDRSVDGVVLRMGVTGNLYHNGLLMWDDRTESWWQQFTGIAIVGSYSGTQLTIIPSQVVGFDTFAARYPDGLVLVGDSSRPYLNYAMNPYIGYAAGSAPLISSESYDTRLQPMALVLAANIADESVAYPFATLQAVGVLHDTLAGIPVVAFWQPGAASALDGATAESSRDIGQAALFSRVLNGEELTFGYADGRFFDDATHSEWNIFGEAVSGVLQGQHLQRYTCHPYFWFAWSSAYPDTRLVEG